MRFHCRDLNHQFTEAGALPDASVCQVLGSILPSVSMTETINWLGMLSAIKIPSILVFIKKKQPLANATFTSAKHLPLDPEECLAGIHGIPSTFQRLRMVPATFGTSLIGHRANEYTCKLQD